MIFFICLGIRFSYGVMVEALAARRTSICLFDIGLSSLRIRGMTFLSRRFFSIWEVHLFWSSRNNPAPYRWRSPPIHAPFSIPFPRIHIHASSRFYLQIASGDGAILISSFLFSSCISLIRNASLTRIGDACVSLIRFVCASNEESIRFVIETEAFAERILTLIVRLCHN